MGTSSRHPNSSTGSALVAGRLTPMAMDNATDKIDSLVLSVATTGMSKSQIAAVSFPTADLIHRIAKILGRNPFRRQRGQ